ncbi:MAG: helix-turn-helix domain-containing protein [Pirellulales bacterium]
MAHRVSANELAKLLDGVAGPIYITNEDGKIVYANRACEEWTGWPAADLVGQTCRYHSAVDVGGAAAIAAAICPPPEVFAGQPRTADISCPTLDGRLPLRRVRFLPLLGDEQDVQAIVALAEPQELTGEEVDESLAVQADESVRLHERLKRLRHAQRRRYALDNLIGDSPAMRRVRSQISLAGASESSVLIVGPPGSGRQHVARAIHYSADPSPAAPVLVPLSCSANSGEALVATLQAVIRSHRVREKAARRGTLLLTDVDLASPDLQAEIVALLSGGNAPLRVVATSREPLAARAARQEYRDDLACLLATLTIELPSLSARPADVPLLAQRMLEEFNVRGPKQLRGWSAEALDRLAAYSWPGNLAELTEVTRESYGMAEGVEVALADLPRRLHLAADAAAHPRKPEETIMLEKFLAEIETELIQRALAKAKGNKTKAAKLLGMTRPKLYRRLVQLGLEEEEK